MLFQKVTLPSSEKTSGVLSLILLYLTYEIHSWQGKW